MQKDASTWRVQDILNADRHISKVSTYHRSSTRDMVGIQEMARYGRLSGVRFRHNRHCAVCPGFWCEGLRIESPDGISSTLKKALAMLGPVLVGVPVDYRDNHRLVEIVHSEALH
jgi:acetolactate synthase I/II/III large subunit